MTANRFISVFAAGAATLCAIAAVSASAAPPAVTALVGGTVVGIDGGAEVRNAAVLITGERIAQVGPADSTAIPPGARIIAMNGKWLMPGLMNMHVHLGLKLPGAAGDSLATETDTQEALRMAGNARLCGWSGRTTAPILRCAPPSSAAK
jgi:imidazolonepropionase-like amidohydrolase